MKKAWTILNSEEEYDRALERTIEIFHADKDTPEGKELDLLIPLVLEYEDIHFHIPYPEPGSDNKAPAIKKNHKLTFVKKG